MRKIIIIGASGHGKVCADIAAQSYDQVEFLDDNPSAKRLGPVSDYKKYIDDWDFFVAIGNNEIRKKVTNQFKRANIVSLVHKNAVVAPNVKIGQGTVVMAGSVINPDTVIGKGCIINTCSSVDHDNNIGDYTHISVGAHLAGTVKVGKNCFICAGSTIINNIVICDNTVVGAGATVVKNINTSGTYIGVPARKIK